MASSMSLSVENLRMSSAGKGKNLLLREQILSFKRIPIE